MRIQHRGSIYNARRVLAETIVCFLQSQPKEGSLLCVRPEWRSCSLNISASSLETAPKWEASLCLRQKPEVSSCSPPDCSVPLCSALNGLFLMQSTEPNLCFFTRLKATHGWHGQKACSLIHSSYRDRVFSSDVHAGITWATDAWRFSYMKLQWNLP